MNCVAFHLTDSCLLDLPAEDRVLRCTRHHNQLAQLRHLASVGLDIKQVSLELAVLGFVKQTRQNKYSLKARPMHLHKSIWRCRLSIDWRLFAIKSVTRSARTHSVWICLLMQVHSFCFTLFFYRPYTKWHLHSTLYWDTGLFEFGRCTRLLALQTRTFNQCAQVSRVGHFAEAPTVGNSSQSSPLSNVLTDHIDSRLIMQIRPSTLRGLKIESDNKTFVRVVSMCMCGQNKTWHRVSMFATSL